MHRDPSPTSPRKCPMLLTITSLVVAANPSEKSWSSSVGMMAFPIDGKKHVPVTTNQHISSETPYMVYLILILLLNHH